MTTQLVDVEQRLLALVEVTGELAGLFQEVALLAASVWSVLAGFLHPLDLVVGVPEPVSDAVAGS
jgi:hypothetical protein